MEGEFQMIKRKISACLAAVSLVFAAGCSQSVSIDANALAEDLKNNGVYAEDLSPVSAQITEKRYAFDEGEVSETVAFAGTRAVVDEIAVFKAESDIDAVVEKVTEHIDAQTQTYQSYRPDELPKLRDAIVTTAGDYVIVCVSADSAKAEEIINSYMR